MCRSGPPPVKTNIGTRIPPLEAVSTATREFNPGHADSSHPGAAAAAAARLFCGSGPEQPGAGTRIRGLGVGALASAGASAAAAGGAADAAACGGARAQVRMCPLPLTSVTVLRRRSARPSDAAASRKAAESWGGSRGTGSWWQFGFWEE